MKINKSIIKKNKNLALVLRHAERFEIKKSEFGNEVLLNENGLQASFDFGKHLVEHKINKIYTSPIQRCVQTAEQIAKGYNQEIEIIKTKKLGDPGIHVTDEVLLGKYYFKYGFWEMFKNFKENIKVDGLKYKEQLKTDFYSFISENATEKGLTLFITHDWLIAFFAYAANVYEYTEKDWINYLEGLIIENGNDAYRL